jgi:hypothetical protein
MRDMNDMKGKTFLFSDLLFMSFMFLLSESLPHNRVNLVNPVKKIPLIP